MLLRPAALLLGLVLAASVPPGLRAGETPDEWLDRMANVAPSTQGVELTYVLIQYRNGRRVEAGGTTRYHADGKRFINELKTQAGDIEVDVRMVCDGETIWTEVREGTTVRNVQKFSRGALARLGGISSLDPKVQVQDLRKRYDLTTVRDGKIGDQDVKILEGVLKPDFVAAQLKAATSFGGEFAVELAKPQLESMAKARVYVEPSSGQFRKTELLDQDGRILLSFEVSGLKTGMDFGDALFAYTPPANVEVMNLESALTGNRPSP